MQGDCLYFSHEEFPICISHAILNNSVHILSFRNHSLNLVVETQMLLDVAAVESFHQLIVIGISGIAAVRTCDAIPKMISRVLRLKLLRHRYY